ncbi:NAC domain-containing protein 71-like [Punica granatum]|uniref:NAC domain-containing protein 71-like n=2 Tax=Punica granatum TaxID=22663 RepID=A0A6P8C061_PUNGR|nr:NAC domain-containing protein 71-like [Punica granatum]
MEVPHIPGLDFDPSSIQLLNHYLKQRNLDYFHSGDPSYSTNCHLIPDIELYNWDPEELPGQYYICVGLADARSNGRQWFFFCLRKVKYRNSSRSERTVQNVGYWNITSSDKKVKSEDTGEEIGKKKTLTFYRGRIPSGIKTNWGMHEYYLNPSYLGYNIEEMPFVVCHVFKRSGRRGDDNVESASHANDDSGGPASSESHAPTHEAASNEELGMWQSLSDIQQLSHDIPDYSTGFTGGAGYHSYTNSDGLFDGYRSNNYYASPDETYDHQQYQGDWNSHNHY